MRCEICQEEIDGFKRLSNHLKLKHNILAQEYHDNVLKTNSICMNPECNNKTRFKNLGIGYLKYCSNKCNTDYNAKNNMNKMREHVKEKFGVDNISHLTEICEQRKTTNQIKYGGNAPLCSSEIKNKVKETNLLKYGVENTFQCEEFKNKGKETCLERYGAENVFKSEIIKDKIKETNLERYGVDNPSKNKDICEQRKKTNNIKYGGNAPLCNDSIKLKSQVKCISKYNSNFFNTSIEYKSAFHDKYSDMLLTNNIIFIDRYDIINKTYKLKCISCDYEFSRYIDSPSMNLRCPKCKQGSGIENKIKSVLDDNNIEYVINERSIIKPYELDFYLPKHNIAIECHGMYWHSEQVLRRKHSDKASSYHLLKYNLCKDNGIQLLQFYEDEINNKFDIVKNIILAKCNRLNKLCGARQCKIKEVDNIICNSFLNDNHIQGQNTGVRINLGTYYNDNLVSLMSFKISIDKVELDRFCTLKGNYIPGIASKLFKHFITNYSYDYIISFADKRISNGNLYDAIKFNFVNDVKPSYFYNICGELKHKMGFRKDKLMSRFSNYDSELTEYQNCLNNGIDRIWDSGKIKYEWKRAA